MGMTIWRWSAAVGLGCAVVAAALLPFPPSSRLGWATGSSLPVMAKAATLREAAGAVNAAVRSYRAARALDRWDKARTVSDTTAVRVDASVPAPVAAAARAIVAEQWAALGPLPSAAHAEVFVYFDSTSIPGVSNSATTRRVVEPHRFVDVAFALPEATDGARCITLVRLRGLSAAHVGALRNQPLIGVCAFFAAFGMPGEGVRRWLATTSYRFARRSDWMVARAPAIDASSLYELSDAGGRCLTGQADGCLSALGMGESTAASAQVSTQRLAWVLDAQHGSYPAIDGNAGATLGGAEDELLADAVRSVGAERFGAFWRSSSSPDRAFLASTGTSMELWTRRWLTTTYGAVGERPTVRLRDVVWLAIAAPVLLVIAARPRERVLAAAR